MLAPVAAISWSSTAHFEDGSSVAPDIAAPDSLAELAAEPAEGSGEPAFSKQALRKMERLRSAIAAVLEKHGIRLLDDAVLGIPVAGLRAGEEVFLGETVTLFDAFFFRGV